MTVLVVAGALYFVALPGYRQAVLKSHRVAARGALLDLMSRQEHYYMDSRRYADKLPVLGLPADYYVDSQIQPVSAQRAVYKIELALDEGAFSGVRAIPQNDQTRDRQCLTLGLSLLGVRSVTGLAAATPHYCW